MRFVVLKGVEGFGDRLQCLLQAIEYADATSRYLVVDWRDDDWSHQDLAFDHYFSLKHVRNFRFDEFAALYEFSKQEADIAPRSWRHKVLEKRFRDYIYQPIFGFGDNAIINEISEYRHEDFDEDVVVYSGVGSRTYHYKHLSKLRLQKWINDRIVSFATEEGLRKHSFDVVHLRGGSKRWNGGVVEDSGLDNAIHERWPHQTAYLDYLHAQLQQTGTIAEPIILSDSRELSAEWIKRFGIGRTLEMTCGASNGVSGIHKLRESDLVGGTSKEQLNYELLRDFVLMLNCRHLVADGVSLMSNMAGGCKATNVTLLEI